MTGVRPLLIEAPAAHRPTSERPPLDGGTGCWVFLYGEWWEKAHKHTEKNREAMDLEIFSLHEHKRHTVARKPLGQEAIFADYQLIETSVRANLPMTSMADR